MLPFRMIEKKSPPLAIAARKRTTLPNTCMIFKGKPNSPCDEKLLCDSEPNVSPVVTPLHFESGKPLSTDFSNLLDKSLTSCKNSSISNTSKFSPLDAYEMKRPTLGKNAKFLAKRLLTELESVRTKVQIDTKASKTRMSCDVKTCIFVVNEAARFSAQTQSAFSWKRLLLKSSELQCKLIMSTCMRHCKYLSINLFLLK